MTARVAILSCLLLSGSPPAETIAGWRVTTSVNPMDDAKSVTIGKPSDEGDATLTIHCMRGRRVLAVRWQKYLGRESAQVMTRVGRGQAEGPKSWGVYEDGLSAFYPGTDTKGFTDSLAALSRADSKVPRLFRF